MAIKIFMRLFLLLLALATVCAFLPVGAWAVRLCDFFRVQVAALSALALCIAAVYTVRANQAIESYCWIAISSVIVLWQAAHVLPYTPLWPKQIETVSESPTQAAPFRVAVVNLEFDNDKKLEVLDQLMGLDSDLLLLIEIDEAWEAALKPLTDHFPYREGVVRGDGVGIMLWSKLRLSDVRVRHLVSDDRASVFARVLPEKGEAFNFVGVHPLPPGLPEENGNGRHDSRIRDAELMLVAKHVAQESDERWVVTGDFNDVAWSKTTRLFQRVSGLHDPRVGRGLYNTYHAEYFFLRFPIDQVFLSPGARIHKLGRFHPTGSDHFAMTADFSFGVKQDTQKDADSEDMEDVSELIREGQNDAEDKKREGN